MAQNQPQKRGSHKPKNRVIPGFFGRIETAPGGAETPSGGLTRESTEPIGGLPIMVPKTCLIAECPNEPYRRGYCSKDYYHERQSGRLQPLPKLTADQRFWEKVNKNGPMHPTIPSLGQCWEWTAAKSDLGYGAFHPRKNHTTSAHRYSLALHLGRPLIAGAFACHTCDNPPCVNPAHLYEGTSQSNVDDAVSRQRHKHGDMGGSKLSDPQVLSIRKRAASGERNRSLAHEFGVNESLISMITRGTRWAHLGGPISKKYTTRKAA